MSLQINTNNLLPLRRLFVLLYVWQTEKGEYERESTRAVLSKIPEFAVDLACHMGTMLADVTATNPLTGDSSAFHEAVSVHSAASGQTRV